MLCNLASSVSDLRSDQIPLKVPFSPELPCSAVDTCIDVSERELCSKTLKMLIGESKLLMSSWLHVL